MKLPILIVLFSLSSFVFGASSEIELKNGNIVFLEDVVNNKEAIQKLVFLKLSDVKSITNNDGEFEKDLSKSLRSIKNDVLKFSSEKMGHSSGSGGGG
jgi:hypothetical protein